MSELLSESTDNENSIYTQTGQFVTNYLDYLIERNNKEECSRLYKHIAKYFNTIPETIKQDFEAYLREEDEKEEELMIKLEARIEGTLANLSELANRLNKTK